MPHILSVIPPLGRFPLFFVFLTLSSSPLPSSVSLSFPSSSLCFWAQGFLLYSHSWPGSHCVYQTALKHIANPHAFASRVLGLYARIIMPYSEASPVIKSINKQFSFCAMGPRSHYQSTSCESCFLTSHWFIKSHTTLGLHFVFFSFPFYVYGCLLPRMSICYVHA